MKSLRQYADENGITYRSAYSHWASGKLLGRKLVSGVIRIEDQLDDSTVLLYILGDSEQEMDCRIKKIRDYCHHQKYKIVMEFREVVENGLFRNLERVLSENVGRLIISCPKSVAAQVGLLVKVLTPLLKRLNQKIEFRY